jgi:hypothetical protein
MPQGYFNPLDPLGLFRSRSGTPAGRSGWSPPDPLRLFNRGDPPASGDDPMKYIPGTDPIPASFNGHLEEIRNQARERLIAKGYTPHQVDLALKWVDDWLMGIARRIAPGNEQLQKSIVQSGYAEIAGRAENWLRGITSAFTVSPNILASVP